MKRFQSVYPIHHFYRPENPEGAAAGTLPQELWEVPRPPSELFIEGSHEALGLLNQLPHRGLAIVGSRECQPRSLREISNTLSELRGFDLIILSGLARGIDAHAHLRAIEEGFPTIAILGCGIEHSYPEENDRLRMKILESGGLVISEFAPDASPKPDHFIRRNRLIAGWSAATWVVEAGPRSGAINTASWTKLQDRPCFVTPCYPGDPTLEGNQRLLETRKVNEGRIRPLWSARSLGEIWLELESFFAHRKSGQGVLPLGPIRKRSPKAQHPSELAEKILLKILSGTLSSGGIPMEEMMKWSFAEKQAPEDIYLALRSLLDAGEIELQAGCWVARPSRCAAPIPSL